MNTKFSDIIQYFRTLAAQHNAIGHSANEKHFYRMELEEVLTNLKDINYPALILEGYRYKLKDQLSDNVLKERTGAFILIDHLSDAGDFDAMNTIWDNMESICDDMIARIKNDKRNPLAKAVRDFDLNTVEIALINNTFSQDYGIRCTYTIVSPYTTDVDPLKWNLEVDIPT